MSGRYVVLRRLTGSELGWFAEPRRQGRARGRQRGINFNASDVARIFPRTAIASGDIPVMSRRISDGQTQRRSIRRQQKNWRLVGPKVSGQGLERVNEGDFFFAEIEAGGRPPYPFAWDVVSRAGTPERHAAIDRDFSRFLASGMASWAASALVAVYLKGIVGIVDGREATMPAADQSPGDRPRLEPVEVHELPSRPIPPGPPPGPRRRRIEGRLRRPHILAEIMKAGLALSAEAQVQFIDALDTLSLELRTQLLELDVIRRIPIDHRKAWADVRGMRIGFVDGGVANVAGVGAAPIAIRVGSYTVTPGDDGPERENFDFEVQLVDDLYVTPGVYEDFFEDVAKLRDAARICCETAGLLALALRERPPDILMLHGPLVNPVSPYALGNPEAAGPDTFPNFTADTVRKFLPGETRARTGREANFVAVYLEQLNRLKSGRQTVCGVVERASLAGTLVEALLQKLHADGRIDAPTLKIFLDRIRRHRLTDSVLLECVLDEGEYIEPVELDKQGPSSKIPGAWAPEIGAYPRPLTTYVKPHVETLPIRVETFPTGPLSYDQLMQLVVHMSRLLPRYAFPVGLDIVDKHAKVPEWMSRQIDAMLSAQLMWKAIESGNPAAIQSVRRLLSTSKRDWLFRPDFRRT
jgi:hypothetical protein